VVELATSQFIEFFPACTLHEILRPACLSRTQPQSDFFPAQRDLYITSKTFDVQAGELMVERLAIDGGPKTVPDEIGKPRLSELSENYLRRLLAATAANSYLKTQIIPIDLTRTVHSPIYMGWDTVQKGDCKVEGKDQKTGRRG